MFKRLFSLMAPEADNNAGGGVTRDAAISFLSDFGHDPKSWEGKDDKVVLETHGRYVAGISKHAPKPDSGNNGAWYDTFKNPDVKEWVKAYDKAYPDTEAMATKAWNLEKFVGADKAGRGVVIPKPDAKPEEWRAFYAKLGVPEKPEGYTIPKEFEKDPMVAKFREHAHKSGYPPMIFDSALGFVASEIKTMNETAAKEFEQRSAKEFEDTMKSWGRDSDAKQEAGRRAAAMFIPHENKEQLQEVLTRMEGALGTAFTLNFWAKIGESFTEHGFVGGDAGDSGAMTPAGARLRINELKADKEWVKKYSSGDVEAKELWDKLHKIAYTVAPAKT